jgi:CRISPR system Cascade subunit CasE
VATGAGTRQRLAADRAGAVALDGYVHGLDADEPVDLERHARQGRECLFRLVANATVTRDGRRFGLRSEEALAGWIRRQAERHGFELLDLRCQPLPRLRAARGRAANAIVLDPALFEGRLRVTVGDALRVALLQGIGHGKALGLGMLSLPRLR